MSAMTATMVESGHARSSASSTWDPNLEAMSESPDNKRYRQRGNAPSTIKAPLTAPLPAKQQATTTASALNALRSRIPAPPLSPGRKRGRLSMKGGEILGDGSDDKGEATTEMQQEEERRESSVPPSSPVRFGTIKDRLKYFDRNASDRKLVRTPFKAAKAKVKSLPFVQLDDLSGHSCSARSARSTKGSRTTRLEEPASPSEHHSVSHRDSTPSPSSNRAQLRDAELAESPTSSPSKPKSRLLSGFRGPSYRKPPNAEALDSPPSSSHRSEPEGHRFGDAYNDSAPGYDICSSATHSSSESNRSVSNLKVAQQAKAHKPGGRGRVPRPSSPLRRTSSPVRRPVQLTMSGCVANLETLSTSSHHRRGLFLGQTSSWRRPNQNDAQDEDGEIWPRGASTPPPSFKGTVGATYQRAMASAIPIKSKLSDLTRNLSNHDSSASSENKNVISKVDSSEKRVVDAGRAVKVERIRESAGGAARIATPASPPRTVESLATSSRLRAPNSTVPTKSKLSDLMLDMSMSSHTSAASQTGPQEPGRHTKQRTVRVVRSVKVARPRESKPPQADDDGGENASPHRRVVQDASQRGFDVKEKSSLNPTAALQTSSRRKPRPTAARRVTNLTEDKNAAAFKENFTRTAEPPVPPSPWGVKLRPSAQAARRVPTSTSPKPRNVSLLPSAPPLSPTNENCPSNSSETDTLAISENSTNAPTWPKTSSASSIESMEAAPVSTVNSTRSKGHSLQTKVSSSGIVSNEESIDAVSHPSRGRVPRKPRATPHTELTPTTSVKAFASSFVFGSSIGSERQAAVSNLFIGVSSPPGSPAKAAAVSSPVRGRKQRESRSTQGRAEREVGAQKVRSKSIGFRASPVKAETSPLPSVTRKHMKEALSSNNDSSVRDRLKLFEALENVNKELMKARSQVSAQRRLTFAERQQQKVKAVKKIQAVARTFIGRRAYARTAAALTIQRAARSTILRASYRRGKAATRIQAFARAIQPRLRYRLMRLQEKLDVIQQRKKSDLVLIQLTKWKTMEDMRKEVEASKAVNETARSTREALQAEITKLKQENASFVEEQQKLTEMHLHFTMMRMMTEQTLQMQNKNYETVHEAVQTLTEKNDALVIKQEKLEARIEFRSQELEELKARITYEKAIRASTEQGVAAMVSEVQSRSTDPRLVKRIDAISNDEAIEDDASVDGESLGGTSRGDKSTRTTECGFELSFRVNGFEDDDISMLDAESTHRSLTRDRRYRSDSKSGIDLDITEEDDEIDEFEEEIIEEFEVVEEVVEDDGDDSCGEFSCESSVYMERSIIL